MQQRRNDLLNRKLLLSWLTALAATLGSLYFSEALHWVPCTLCWYQRIFMYPLAFILGVAFYKNDNEVIKYVIPLSMTGMAISVYHTLLQKIPYLQQFEMCTSGVPCSSDYLNLFDFITIPMLAFVAFFIITLSSLIALRAKEKE